IIFSVEVSSPVSTITSLSRAEVASSVTPSLPKPSKRFSRPRAFKLDQVVQSLDYTIFDIASLSKRWRHLLIRGIGSRVICSRSARIWGTLAWRVPTGTWRARHSWSFAYRSDPAADTDGLRHGQRAKAAISASLEANRCRHSC